MSTREFCRPDPEELLRKIEAEEAQARRGRLKIFLGYAPHVGKSFRMFDEGRRRAERGQDVIAGAMQSKGSEELAPLLANFEVIPLARRSEVSLAAPRADPSFFGAFLPAERRIDEKSFEAHWQVLDLNRSFGQHWQQDAQRNRSGMSRC